MTLLAPGDAYTLLEVFLLLTLAQVVRSLTRGFGVPEIVADLVAGMVVGSYALGGYLDGYLPVPIFAANPGLELFAGLSVILLLFSAGLGGGLTSLRNAGRYAVLAAIVGDLVPFGITLAVFSRFYPLEPSLLIAVAAAATSAAVAASLLQRSPHAHTAGAQLFMNAAALDDVVALLLLSIALAAIGGNVDLLRLTGSVTTSVIAWLVLLVAAVVVIPRLLKIPLLAGIDNLPFTLLFGIVAIVLALGFSPIIGAYIAGLAIAESAVAERTRAIAAVLVALFGGLFFVVVGTEFDVHDLADPTLLLLAVVLATIAAAGKFAGVYPFAFARLRSAAGARAVAFGMIPRGEIGLIVGAIGVSSGILNQQMLGEIVLMAVITTLVGALLFRSTSDALAVAPAPNGSSS